MILSKWRLCGDEGHTPNDQGLDEFLGFLPGAAMFADFDDPKMVKSIQAFDLIDQTLVAESDIRSALQQGTVLCSR